MSKSNEYWNNLSKHIKRPSETKNKRPDTSDLEVAFLENYLHESDEIIDVGCGTGLITNKLINKVKHITAVEKFEGFTKFIIDSPNILVINADIVDFKIRKLYDVVLLLGVAQYFIKEEAEKIYRNLYSMTKDNGYLIVRNHCGLEMDKTVNGFSDELGTYYFAEYRQIDEEMKMLRSIGFSEVKNYDILPDTINVWNDTRHFFIICKK